MTDRMIRGGVALWFLSLAVLVAGGVTHSLLGNEHLTGLDYARFVSKACLVSFLALIGYLTIVRDNPVAQAKGWQPRISAFLGTNLIFIGVLFLPPRNDLTNGQHLLSALAILVGNLFALYVLSYLARSFSIMAEARRLVSDGPYSIVRHPLYLAEEIAIIGTFIQFASMPMMILIAIHFVFQIRRMLNEEKVLRETFAEYAAYMQQTPRIIPAIW